MARQPLNITPPNTMTRTVLYDIDGSIILQIGYDEFMVQPQVKGGPIEIHKNSSYIRLVDGTQWSPMLMLAKPPVHVGVCDHCRRPPFIGLGRGTASHGIVTLNRAKTCSDCGALCCPKHFSKCRDGKYRCKQCAQAVDGLLKRLINFILFTNGGD
jgi:hypothetical protein